MRRYLFLDGDPAKLPGWKLYTNRGDGHPLELMPDGMRESDAFPEHTLLVEPVGTCWQLCALSNSEERRLALEQSIYDAAVKAGILVYLSAKAFALAKPAVADAHLYERVAVLDAKGLPTGATAKKLGAPLQVKCCLAGDDPVKAADPKVEPVERIR